ncbi:MAG: ribosomal protein S18-alanine N-acetyltransferase [Agathobacter sp.]
MIIRRMTFEDVKSVAQIEAECFSMPWSETGFEDSLAREDTVFLVCVDEGVVGYIGMYLSFEEGEITNVAVTPSYRQRGCGNLLIEAVKKEAKARNAECVILEVRVSNEPAISLYKKNGFEEIGIRKNFYEHPKEDAIIMKVGI